MPPWRLRDFVQGGGRPPIPETPTLGPLYVALMQQCWAPDPHRRPPFRSVAEALPRCRRA